MVLLNKGEEIRFASLTGNEGRRYICLHGRKEVIMQSLWRHKYMMKLGNNK
jgi:hypothetical protein